MNSLRLLFYFPLSTRVSPGLCSLRLPRQPEPCRCPAARPLPAVGLPCHWTAADSSPATPPTPQRCRPYAPTPSSPPCRPTTPLPHSPPAQCPSAQQPCCPTAPPTHRPTARASAAAPSRAERRSALRLAWRTAAASGDSVCAAVRVTVRS